MSTLQENLDAIKLDKDTNLKPENLKAGVTCLGVYGTYEGQGGGTVEGIKQFSTIEEMNNSTGNEEGDLAIVYGSKIQSATADSKFQVVTFPETVVLDTAMTDYVEVSYRAVDGSMFDCWGQLDSSMFTMDCYTETREVRVEYTSSDGITYTRTDTTGNPVDFGTEIYYRYADRWNDAIGKFIQVGGNTFEGLYEYSSGWVLASTQLSAISDYVYEKEFYGKNGVESGTLQNKENLTKDEVKHRVNIWSNYNSGIVCPTNSSQLFSDCKNLTTIPLLDTSSVTNMSLMLSGCTNLTTIPLLNTGNVTDMSNMFRSCVNLTTIPLLNTSSVINMNYMLSNCKKLTEVPLLDTSKVTNMDNMFSDCINLATIPQLDTSSVTNMYRMFYGCTNLTAIPQLDTSSVTNISGMFLNCENLTEIPLLDTSSATDMSAMFSGCTNLTAIPQLDTSSVTNMHNMFDHCKNLTTIPLLNTSKATRMDYMFGTCESLTEIPLLDTSSVTDMGSMFVDCTNLTTVPVLNTSNVIYVYDMFLRCPSLSDESLNNILAMCATSSYTGTKTLKNVGLTSSQATRCRSLSNYSAFTAAGWTTGY